MTVDDYIGKVTRQNTQAPPPPQETVDAFHGAIDRALALARARVAANPRDADAHYQLGAAVGLRASYIGDGRRERRRRVSRRARGLRRARARPAARSGAQGRRSDRRHLSLSRRHAGAAAALGRLCRGLRRRSQQGAQADRGSGRISQRQPDRSAVRADPYLQPRATVRRCAQAAGDVAGPLSAQPPGVARNRSHESARGAAGRSRPHPRTTA